MDVILHTYLDALDSSLTTLIHAFTSTPTASTAPDSLTSLLNADDALTSALKLLQTHQKNHKRILTLQGEADNLATRVKSAIQRCHDTRNEAIAFIGDDDSESDQEDVSASSVGPQYQHSQQEIDYTTLLNFAQRIARYNTTAERDAAELALRRKAEIQNQRLGGPQNGAATTNGLQPIPAPGAENKAEDQMLTPQIRNWLNSQAEYTKAVQGMPFPNPERLREGILGTLQSIREQDGEDGVWREIERLENGGKGMKDASAEEPGEEVMELERRPEQRERERPVQHQVQQQQARAPEEKKALDLDLYNEDDDDDDDI